MRENRKMITNLMLGFGKPLIANSWLAKSWLVALLGVPLFPTPVAQSLYMPRTVKEAIRKGTRSLDGKPGPNYWENHGRYSISLTAAPPDRTIRGTEQISYSNNSPDTLKSLVFGEWSRDSVGQRCSHVHMEACATQDSAHAARLGEARHRLALRDIAASWPRRNARLDHLLSGVFLPAHCGLRRLQRLGYDGFHGPAGVLQRLQ